MTHKVTLKQDKMTSKVQFSPLKSPQIHPKINLAHFHNNSSSGYFSNAAVVAVIACFLMPVI